MSGSIVIGISLTLLLIGGGIRLYYWGYNRGVADSINVLQWNGAHGQARKVEKVLLTKETNV